MAQLWHDPPGPATTNGRTGAAPRDRISYRAYMMDDMMARRQTAARRSAISGWPRRLALLLAVVLAIFPALGFAAVPGGHPMPPVAHAGRSVPAHHHHLMQRQVAADAIHAPCRQAPGHNTASDRGCCNACPFAIGLVATAGAPALSPHFTRVARLSDAAPPGVPVSAPIEPPRS